MPFAPTDSGRHGARPTAGPKTGPFARRSAARTLRGFARDGGSLARRILLALLLVVANAAPAHAAGPEPWNGGPTPPLSLKDLDGREVRLEALRGRVVVVNFWATWCAPCVLEMPSLQRLKDRHARRGLEVIAVNQQENTARIRPFLERFGLDLTVVRDHDGSARSAWRVGVFPTTYAIARDGSIAFVVAGEADWDRAPIETAIRHLLDADPRETQRRASASASTFR